MIKHKLLVLLGFLIPSLGLANYLPENHAVNGGVAIVPVDLNQNPEVFYNKSRIAVVESSNAKQWLMVVGIPLNNTSAIQFLDVLKPLTKSIPFYVSDKFYKTQYLTITDSRKVSPLTEDQQRIDAENNKLAQIFAHFSTTNPFKSKFQAPARGPITSLFGLKRVYNQQPRPSHTGLDIAAPQNDIVRSINPGVVVEANDYFYTGNTVIVDHGMGVFSLYGHLDKMNVQINDQVQQGTPLGTVGMTGRATGPHLHWSMIINQAYVDPLLFVSSQAITLPPTPKIEQKKG